MPPVTVLFKVVDAARQPVQGRGVTGKLISPDGLLADHTGTVVTEAQAVSGEDGLVQLQLTPQSEIAASGTHYEIQVMHSWTRFWCVVPDSDDPVQLADILVDPNTLTPVPAPTPSIWLSRAELGQPGGAAPLDEDGLIPAEHLPAGGDAVPATRQVLAGPGLTGGGTLAADRTLLLNAASLASLGRADTAVQPGQLASVATSGSYGDLTGKPAIPASYADLAGLVPTSALPALAVTEYLGPVASQAAMLALIGQQGDWCIRTDSGLVWFITGANPAELASWTALSYPAAPVAEVNGQVGVVELGKADVGLDQVANLAPGNLPISDATQAALDGMVPLALVDAAGDLLVGSGPDTLTRLVKGANGQVLTMAAGAVTWAPAAVGDRDLYQPAAAGLLEWTADPKDCETDFNCASGNLLMVRFRYRGSASVISEIGFAVTSAASGPGAYSGVALYEDGAGLVNRLGQSADAGAQWTSPGVKSIPLAAPVNVTPGSYYRAAILFVGAGAGKIAGCAATILDPLLNHGTRRSVYLSGQSAFPASLTVSSMSTNNALYWLAMK